MKNKEDKKGPGDYDNAGRNYNVETPKTEITKAVKCPHCKKLFEVDENRV